MGTVKIKPDKVIKLFRLICVDRAYLPLVELRVDFVEVTVIKYDARVNQPINRVCDVIFCDPDGFKVLAIRDARPIALTPHRKPVDQVNDLHLPLGKIADHNRLEQVVIYSQVRFGHQYPQLI